MFSRFSDLLANSPFNLWDNLTLQMAMTVSSNAKKEASPEARANVTICCNSIASPFTCSMEVADASFPSNTFFNIA